MAFDDKAKADIISMSEQGASVDQLAELYRVKPSQIAAVLPKAEKKAPGRKPAGTPPSGQDGGTPSPDPDQG